MSRDSTVAPHPQPGTHLLWKRIVKHWQLYLLLLFPLTVMIIFKYVPIYSVQIAFRDYNPSLGVAASPWVGLKHFTNFFNSHQFVTLFKNTMILGLLNLILGIPLPIILALGINSCRRKALGKSAQLLTYAPYFISTVIVVSMTQQILATHGGLFNNVRSMFGLEAINLLADPKMFRPIYIITEMWKGTGYAAVLYIATLASINPELYEAAKIDGANIWQRIRHIEIPSIMSVAVILLIINSGQIINVSHEKVLLLQNQLNMDTADVISTYVYRIGIVSSQYSYSAAIGLFNSIISVVMLLLVNWIAKKVGESSLF